jgi:hypothetical protein
MFAFSKRISTDRLQLNTTLEGKNFRVTLSDAAQRALAQRSTPLIAEMELYFSCLIRLRVRFYERDEEATATPVNAQLSVRFRPVMSRSCDLHEVQGKPPLGDFPIVKRAPYVPHWLHLDYKKGEWVGEFGYRATNG